MFMVGNIIGYHDITLQRHGGWLLGLDLNAKEDQWECNSEARQ